MIIPKPNKCIVKEGYLYIGDSVFVDDESGLLREFLYIIDDSINRDAKESKQMSIRLSLNKGIPKEGYELEISSEEVLISASEQCGIFYAFQTLKQLLIKNAKKIPCCIIKDTPRFSYRGFMLDLSRHFYGVGEVKKIIDLMAMLKLNKLHLHLTDDQGWRIALEKYPLLEQVASKRKETWIKDKRVEKPVEGCFSKVDIEEILKYASKAFIEVIPEIDFPGHIRSAIAAYPHLSCTQEQISVDTRFGISQHILCAGKESTYQFLEDIFDEIIKMFKPRSIHIGADEVPKDRWKECSACQSKIMELNLKDEEELQTHMINRMVTYLQDKVEKVIAWNDGLNDNTLRSELCIQYWVDSKKKRKLLHEQVKEYRKLIISDYYHYYFDMPHSLIPLRKVYNHEPVPKQLRKSTDNILGIEAALWTEYVTTTSKLEEMILPRLFAVAESAWTYSENKNYKDFIHSAKILNKYLKLYRYHITPMKEAESKIIKIPSSIYQKGVKFVLDYDLLVIKKKLLKLHKKITHFICP